MAKKRLKKKQQAKKNIEQLKSIGINKKEIKKLKNNTNESSNLIRKEKRRITANNRSAIIKSFGYKVKDHSAKRYWSEERWNEWVRSEQRKIHRQENKKRDENDLYLLIFWRDKTAEGFADTELIERYKYQYRHLSNEILIDSIKHSITADKPHAAEIGTTSVIVVKGGQRKEYIRFMTQASSLSSAMSESNDWVLVYEGKVKRYHDLLLAVHAVVRLLYDASERGDFITDMILKKLPQINKNMAERFAKDIGWRSF